MDIHERIQSVVQELTVQGREVPLDPHAMLRYRKHDDPSGMNGFSLSYVTGKEGSSSYDKSGHDLSITLARHGNGFFTVSYTGEQDGALRISQYEQVDHAQGGITDIINVPLYVAQFTQMIAKEANGIERITLPGIREVNTTRYPDATDEERYLQLVDILRMAYDGQQGYFFVNTSLQ